MPNTRKIYASMKEFPHIRRKFLCINLSMAERLKDFVTKQGMKAFFSIKVCFLMTFKMYLYS